MFMTGALNKGLEPVRPGKTGLKKNEPGTRPGSS